MTDGGTNTLALRGLEESAHASRGLEALFSSCAVVSVFGSGRKLVLVVHTTMYLEYHTVVVLC
jgi:hypothetical protein